MSIKKLGLALAVSALASGANAALYVTSDDAGNTGGSSLLFAAYDAATTNTLYVDLNALAPNMRVHTLDRDGMPAQTINLASVAAANNFSLANVQWTVVGGDAFVLGAPCSTVNLSACGQTYMATVSAGDDLPVNPTASSVVTTIGGVNNSWFLNVRGAIDAAGGSTTVADGSFGQWTQGIVPAQTFWNVTGTTGESLSFAMVTVGANAGPRGVVSQANGVSSMLPGTWTLSENNTLTYSAVPVPAAVWMFASGLVGLAGVARRRKQA